NSSSPPRDRSPVFWRCQMKVRIVTPLAAIAASAWFASAVVAQRGAPPPSPYPVTQGKVTRFEKVAEGVYYATGAGGGNSPIVIGDRDVLVVDTNTTPAGARAFLED